MASMFWPSLFPWTELKSLSIKRMVKGLPNMKEPEQVYVTCVLGKQAQEYFSAGIL
jgi:hypothetical protein